VLIDSRTGLTDTGGVCTIQLPDVVVVMFTTNYQSLLGARDVMQHVREARQELAYPRMQLTVFPLPSRFATAAEFEESKRWVERIGREFAEFYEDWLPASAQPREVLERVKVPQKDYFSFGEKLPVIEEGVADPTGMGHAYDQVARVLVDDFEATDKVLGLRERTREPPPVVDDYRWNIFVSFPPGPSLQPWVDEFVDLVRAEMEPYERPGDLPAAPRAHPRRQLPRGGPRRAPTLAAAARDRDARVLPVALDASGVRDVRRARARDRRRSAHHAGPAARPGGVAARGQRPPVSRRPSVPDHGRATERAGRGARGQAARGLDHAPARLCTALPTGLPGCRSVRRGDAYANGISVSLVATRRRVDYDAKSQI
jgi:hypothetical protein